MCTRACFKKNSSLHICPTNFSTTFFRILPQNFTFDLSEILMTFFSHHPFLRSSTLPYYFDTLPSFLFLNSTFSRQKFLNAFLPCFTDDDSYFLLFAHYTPRGPLCIHPHAVFHVSTPCFVLS